MVGVFSARGEREAVDLSRWQGPFQMFEGYYFPEPPKPKPAPPVARPRPTKRKRPQRWRNTPRAKAWAQAVKDRDGVCRCGSEGPLHAHHKNRSEDMRFVLENGIALCVACHRAEHPELPSVLFAV